MRKHHTKKINNTQTIKGNQPGLIVPDWFPCYISVRGGGGGNQKIRPVTGRDGAKEEAADGSDQMPQPQMQAAHFG